MEIVGFGATDLGCRREKNEDAYLIDTSHNLYVVADGMGGHLGGEFASRMAVTTIGEAISNIMQDPEMTLQSNIDIRPGDYKSYLKYAISTASGRIFDRSSRDPSLRGMGTTVVAVMFHEGKAYYANVGDSRCYFLRAGKLKQLTKDHSLVGEQLRAGIINPGDIKNHKLKNIITRSVGFQEDVEADINVRNVRTGDKLLLCTDGLTNLVSAEEIEAVVAEKSPKDACNELIELANSHGGDDNITAIVAEVAATEFAATGDEPTEGI